MGSELEGVRDSLVVFVDRMRSRLRPAVRGKRVIAFHDVKDPARFRDKVEWLKARYEIVSLEELFLRAVGARTQLALTFDDGFVCWHEAIGPILERLGLPAVFFVCSGFVGLQGERAERFRKERLRRRGEIVPLTKNQLTDLAQHPLFEIGSHTVNHVDVGKVRDEKVLEEEVLGDRQRLEDWTGRRVRWFAYPFGRTQRLHPSLRRWLDRASFEAAFTLVPGFLNRGDDPFLTGRDSLDVRKSNRLFSARLNGAYDQLYLMKERLRASMGA